MAIAFLAVEQQKRGLAVQPPADKRTLLRRATLDLTGLVPTPKEIEAFLADKAPDAYERAVDRLLTSPRYGERWGVRELADPASLPVLAICLAVFFFLATPLTNSLIRFNEHQADIFGLNAARAPDGFARSALRLGAYRKLEPGPIEEMIFYDHPSGATRIRMSMQWKSEHLGEPGVR